MAAHRTGTGIARNLLVGVAILLVAGIAGSLFMGVHAQRAQIRSTVDQATNIADNSLGLVFRPDDLAALAATERAADLDTRVSAAVLDPSGFDSVTLWSQDAQILYSTQGRIGNTLEAERDRIREALKGNPQTQNIGGVFSVMVPMALHSGVGTPAAVELTTPAGPINAAPQPWRTNALFLLVLLAIVGFALYRVMYGPGSARAGASAAAVERAAAAGHVTSHGGRPVAAPPSPGLREEGDARRKAEDRARAAEERLATLQSQYRNTLEELQTSQKRIQEQAAAARPDPRLQDQLAKTEQRAREQEVKARELQARLRVLEEEQRELVRAAPDPAVIEATNERLAEVTRERDTLLHEQEALKSRQEGIERERDTLKTEKDTLQGRQEGAERERDDLRTERDALAAERDTISTERDAIATERDAIAAQRDEVAGQRDELAAHRAELAAQRDELAAQRDELAERLAAEAEAAASAPAAEDPALAQRAHQAETEAIGLRAELEGAQTELTMALRELESLREVGDRTKELQEDLDAAHVDTLHNRESYEVTRAELQAAQAELDDARTELRTLRTEEQRATMLEDELRAVRAELDSATASQRAELVERETEFESKVRDAREEFQAQIASLDTQHQDDLAMRDRKLATRLAAVEAAAEAKVERVRQELADRDARYGAAEQVVAEAREEASRLGEELTHARLELDETVQRLLNETNTVRELGEKADFMQREAGDASTRAERLAEALDDATQSNADLNRRLQELEARRALEIADTEGRADLDQLLRVTQERLAGQTERLIAAEDNVHRLERELTAKAEQIDQIEGELRHVQMAEAMRQIRGEGLEAADEAERADGAGLPAPPAGVDANGEPLEDRRATSPFMKELSHDARKSLTQILGLTQILKHKKDAKEQAQLVRQLTTYARRLDHVVSDMADADKLVRGTIELTIRRTDLEALVHRVVEESGIGADHEVRIDAERVVVALDQLRTEQILAGLLRSSADRTPAKKPIAVRLQNHHGGALLSVEDPEPSSDASLSPVVQRFAEVQGGWAKVESIADGEGSAFRVFLPDGAKASTDDPTSADDPEGIIAAELASSDAESTIVVADQEVEPEEEWSPEGAQLLVQELHRLSEIAAED